MAKRSLSWLLALTLPASVHADSAVWVVTEGGSRVYLGGTMHKLTPQQYPLPPEYQAAYEDADITVFETDIGAMHSPEVQARVATGSRLPDGQSLSSLLEPAIYEHLRQYCEETGFPLEYLDTLRPSAAMLTLLTVALQSLGVTAPGVDEHFFERARADSKAVHALETVDEQIEHMLSLDRGDPDRFVRQSIEDLREARNGAMDEELRVWREGEQNALVEHFLNEQMLYSPELYQSLLVDRNRDWMPSIRRYVDTPQTELVLVGVAHLVGEHGLVTLLRDEGYSVEKYTTR